MTTQVSCAVYVLLWMNLVRQAFALFVEDALPMNAAQIGEDSFQWDYLLNGGVSSGDLLVKRDGSCSNGSHPCQYTIKISDSMLAQLQGRGLLGNRILMKHMTAGSDINSTLCCLNAEYCIVDTDWEPSCCGLGSVCDNPCDADHYLANDTVTITSSGETSVTVEMVCSGRQCSGSNYACPTSLGGGCCGYGNDCATNAAGSAVCLAVTAASTAGTSGCATGQFQCGVSSSAEYCCSSGELCTSIQAPSATTLGSSSSSGYACQSLADVISGNTASSKVAQSTSTGNSNSTTRSRSTSLKIGLGVGIPVGLLCVGGLLSFGIWQRRTRLLGREGRESPEKAGPEFYEKPELPNEPVQVPVELDAHSMPPELIAGKGLKPELAGNEIMAELPSRNPSQMEEREGDTN